MIFKGFEKIDKEKLKILKNKNSIDYKKVRDSISNLEFFLFEELKIINNYIKTLNEDDNIKLDQNTKKIHLKLNSALLKNSKLKKTQFFFEFLFFPTKNLKYLEKRLNIIKKLKEEYEISKLDSLSDDDFELNFPKNFPYRLLTNNIEIKKKIEEEFEINVFLYSDEELSEKEEFQDNDIIVSEEYILLENYKLNPLKLKETRELILGYFISNNFDKISKIFEVYQENIKNVSLIYDIFFENFNVDLKLSDSFEEYFHKIGNINLNEVRDAKEIIFSLDEVISKKNEEIKNLLSSKQLSLDGEDLVSLMASGDISVISKKIEEITKEKILNLEKEIILELNKVDLKTNFLFSNYSYPIEIDQEIKEELYLQLDKKKINSDIEKYSSFGKFQINDIKKLLKIPFLLDLFNSIFDFIKESGHRRISQDHIELKKSINNFIENPSTIDYELGTRENPQRISILTGANSGGKTTLLELIIQEFLLFFSGLPSKTETLKFPIIDQVIYLKKFSGNLGSGAFEQTIREIIQILNSNERKLILIDEFEAVTEPGAAARILFNFLKLISNKESYVVTASHLGEELIKLINKQGLSNKIRIDGISANGIDENGNLITNHQPEFGKLGRSTPDLILKKILNDEKFWKNKEDKLRKNFNDFLKEI